VVSGPGGWEWKASDHDSAQPADPSVLPPIISGFGAVPPLVTDLNLSVDDRFLYVSCFGTGELRQYGVSDPFNPQLTPSRRSVAS
jgi:selenium-binding protein 1